jgi:hypothetical protein
VITDGQLILGLSRHLSAYSVSPIHARLESLQFAGQVYEMAWRLRHAQLSSAARVQAIGIEAKIGPRVLDTQILPTLEQLGWARCDRYDNGSLYSVAAFIPPDTELLESVTRLLDLVMASPVERAALVLLDATSVQPLEREAALQHASAYGDEAAEEALRCLINIHLVREVVVDDGRKVVFNPNIWVGDEQVAKAALKAEDAHVNAKVGALLEEVIAFPGLPEEHVRSTEPRQYHLVRPFRSPISTFPPRHARASVDDSPTRLSSFYCVFSWAIFSPWVRPGLVQWCFLARV